jgi:hypothetical protein
MEAISIPLIHMYIIVHFLGLLQALQKKLISGGVKHCDSYVCDVAVVSMETLVTTCMLKESDMGTNIQSAINKALQRKLRIGQQETN